MQHKKVIVVYVSHFNFLDEPTNEDVVVLADITANHETTNPGTSQQVNNEEREIAKKELLSLAKISLEAQKANSVLNKFNCTLSGLVDDAKSKGQVQ